MTYLVLLRREEFVGASHWVARSLGIVCRGEPVARPFFFATERTEFGEDTAIALIFGGVYCPWRDMLRKLVQY